MNGRTADLWTSSRSKERHRPRMTRTRRRPAALSQRPSTARSKLAGADANGDILFQALQANATLTVQTGMSLTATTNGVAVVLTVPAATAANDVEPGGTA